MVICLFPDCSNELMKGKRKYCSDKCGDKDRYRKNKKVFIERTRKWQIDNPEKTKKNGDKSMLKFRTEKRERFNYLMRRNYYRNKLKWKSRRITNFILNGEHSYKKYNPLIKKCKKCLSILNLEIHHEIYPIKKKEIIIAIDEGKIYYLCRKCHRAK